MNLNQLDPNSPEVLEAVLRRIDSITKEEWDYWIDKLSHAPEGVYDPWSEENWPREKALREAWKSRALAADSSPSPEAERAAGSD